MKKLHFLFKGRLCTALLPHCAEEGPVLQVIHNVQVDAPPTQPMLFVFDEQCKPTTISVKAGMPIRMKPETDTLFVKGKCIVDNTLADHEYRVLSDQLTSNELAELLTTWRQMKPSQTGVTCYDEVTGRVMIVDLRAVDNPSFDRGSIAPLAGAQAPVTET